MAFPSPSGDATWSQRQTVHTWLPAVPRGGGWRDCRPLPATAAVWHQISAGMERMVCDLRRRNPRWGRGACPELRRQGVAGIPGRTSIYRVLDRNQLIEPFARRRRRALYRFEGSG